MAGVHEQPHGDNAGQLAPETADAANEDGQSAGMDLDDHALDLDDEEHDEVEGGDAVEGAPSGKKKRRKKPIYLYLPDGKQFKRRKKLQDPQKPKRALPPFMLYCADQRVSVAEEFPDAPLKKMTSIMGERWANLPEATKQLYHQRHDENRRVYEEALAAYESERKFPCGVCTVEVQEDEEAIMCEQSCERWFHRECAKMSPEAYDLVASEPLAVWMCDECLAEVPSAKAKAASRRQSQAGAATA